MRTLFILFLLFCPLHTGAQNPPVISYQGHIRAAGSDFNGVGQFKFALVNDTGTIHLWSHDGTSSGGAQPNSSLAVPVVRGQFSVRLGDVAVTNMVPLPAHIFSRNDLRLRVWFNDGENGFQQLAPDQPVASVPYAFNADSLDGFDSMSFALKAEVTAYNNALLTEFGNTWSSLQLQLSGIDVREAVSTARLDGKDQNLQTQITSLATQTQATLGAHTTWLGGHAAQLAEDRSDINGVKATMAEQASEIEDQKITLNEALADLFANQVALNEHRAALTSTAAELAVHASKLSEDRAAITNVQTAISEHLAVENNLISAGGTNRTDLKVAGETVASLFDEVATEMASGRAMVLDPDGTNRWVWGAEPAGFYFGRLLTESTTAAYARFNEVSGWSFNENLEAPGLKVQEMLLGSDGPVPGLQINTTGAVAGIMRYRNILEVWPNTNGTAAGKIDVRDLAGAPMITLDGADGSVAATSLVGILVNTSDRNVKEHFEPIDSNEILSKVAALPITRWTYKQRAGAAHLGPMAQDFHAAFDLGADDKTIAAVDADGVALAAIQALHQRLEQTRADLKARDALIEGLENRLLSLEKLLAVESPR